MYILFRSILRFRARIGKPAKNIFVNFRSSGIWQIYSVDYCQKEKHLGDCREKVVVATTRVTCKSQPLNLYFYSPYGAFLALLNAELMKSARADLFVTSPGDGGIWGWEPFYSLSSDSLYPRRCHTGDCFPNSHGTFL